MVVEAVVLLGVEHLQQGCRGVAAEVHAHLVDLVEQDQLMKVSALRIDWMILPGIEPI